MEVPSVNFHYVRRNSSPLVPRPGREDVEGMIGKVRQDGIEYSRMSLLDSAVPRMRLIGDFKQP